MIETSLVLKKAIDVQKLLAEQRERLDLGTARAADVVLGELRRASMQDPLHKRTGNLAKSWTAERKGPLEFLLASRLPYAAILEYGGDIVPKNAKALAIPVGEALTAGGVPRYTTPRAVDGLFMLRSKAGNLMLARRSGKGALDVMFILKQKVSMPAFRYASAAVKAATDRAITEIRRAVAK